MNIFSKVMNRKGNKLNVEQEAKFTTQKGNISPNKDDKYKYLNYHTYSKKMEGFIDIQIKNIHQVIN